jgi:hypothetical protein
MYLLVGTEYLHLLVSVETREPWKFGFKKGLRVGNTKDSGSNIRLVSSRSSERKVFPSLKV